MSLSLKGRSADERLLILLSLICLLGLIPFSVYRFSIGDVLVGLIDCAGIALCLGCAAYVYYRGQTHGVGFLLASISVAGISVIAINRGPEDVFFLYPTVIGAFFLTSPGRALLIGSLAIVLVSVGLLEKFSLVAYFKFAFSLAGCLVFAYYFATLRNRQRDELLHTSTRDGLTGAWNRRAFDERIEELVQGYQRHPSSLSLIMIDLDDFKLVNDKHGHDVGDRVLQGVTEVIMGRIRATDYVFRYGGDEFVVLVSDSDLEKTLLLAQDLRLRVASLRVDPGVGISTSVGVAEYQSGMDAGGWLKAADEALFRAKREGRNQVASGASD